MPSARLQPPPEDSLLVQQAREGDREAFGTLVERHQRKVWLVCRQYLGPEAADEATQDSFIKAFRNLQSFDGRAAFTTWVTRIAINTCLDTLRRRTRRPTALRVAEREGEEEHLERLCDEAASPEERSMQRQAVARLRELEEDLSTRQREVFRLRFYAEMELDDIASALGVHVGTVKTQLHRAVHRLRQALGEHR
jgi:RNA polymerase sigma-70 factor (ECF subfamily)